MSFLNAVVHIDQRFARVLRFDRMQVQEKTVCADQQYTRRYGYVVRSEHEFFGDVCNEIDGVADVLLTGTRAAVTRFRSHVGKHRPRMAERLTGEAVIDHAGAGELLALARARLARCEDVADMPPSG